MGVLESGLSDGEGLEKIPGGQRIQSMVEASFEGRGPCEKLLTAFLAGSKERA